MSSILKHQRVYAFIVVIVALALQGCGGRKVVPTTPAELAIPPDMARAFEVKDLPSEQGIEGNPIQAASETMANPSKGKKTVKVKKSASAKGFKIPLRRPKVDPILVGEKIFMDVTWLATKAGEFLLEVLPHKEMNGRRVYNFKGFARTSELFSMVYKAEDSVETFVDYEGWFPYKFTLHGDETKHVRNTLELFDHSARKQYVHIHDFRIQKNEVHEKKGYQELVPLAQDSLSSLYYARTLDLKDGAVLRFPATQGGNVSETQITVLGREDLKTRMGTKRAIKTKVETRFNGVLQQKGDQFIWFSDDERRYPLRFEAKVKIGWISGITREITPGQLVEEEQPAVPQAKPKGDQAGLSAQVAVSGVDKAAYSEPKRTTGPKPKAWFNQLLQSTEDSDQKKQ